ncbi:ketoacyl-ACP synthase III [Fictibacillus sp. NRS-1165]|uniref:ketoacyl-ACP synthase III n=1 Tax=Fictibacillus sp. NRS-1165 TaxID=3144463 RepID=UPI003D237A3A
MKSKARLTAIGTYVPEKVLTNEDLQKLVDTSDEWIVQRTGMKERRVAGEHEFASTLAIKAVQELTERYSKGLDDVDAILVSTTTPDFVFPSVACQIQDFFGIPHTLAYDFNATCAGFTYGLHMANSLITSGLHNKILVVAAETLTKATDYTDRSTCILFGDGAAAVLIERDEEHHSFLSAHYGTNGDGGRHVYRTNFSTSMKGWEMEKTDKMVQNGREVYKWAVRTIPEGIHKLIDQAAMKLDDVDWFVPHSANLRMIESICEKAGFPEEKMLTSVEFCGNTSSVSIPLAMDLAIKKGKLNDGDILLLYGFGGGLTHAGQLLRWSPDPAKQSH